MLWAIDAGNTRLKAVAFEGSRPLDKMILSSALGFAAMRDGLAAMAARLGKPDIVTIASTAGDDAALQAMVETATGGADTWMLTASAQTAIELRYDPPESLGADRIANAIAAKSMFGGPAIVVDVGTACTLEAVDAEGVMRGGAILPGLELSLRSLADGAERLPEAASEFPSRAIGESTELSIRAGVFFGLAGAIDRLVELTMIELGGDPIILLTGGSAQRIHGALRVAPQIEPELTLQGIRLAYEQTHRAL